MGEGIEKDVRSNELHILSDTNIMHPEAGWLCLTSEIGLLNRIVVAHILHSICVGDVSCFKDIATGRNH